MLKVNLLEDQAAIDEDKCVREMNARKLNLVLVTRGIARQTEKIM